MTDFTPQRLVRAGRTLARVWNDEAMDLAMNILREDYKNRIIATGPGEEEQRETLYRQYHALQDLEGVVLTLIEAARRDVLEQVDDEDPDNEY